MLCILEHYRHITASRMGSLPKHNVLFCCCHFCGLTLFIFANSHHNLIFFPAIFIIVVLYLLLFFIFFIFHLTVCRFLFMHLIPSFLPSCFPLFSFLLFTSIFISVLQPQFSSCFISSFRFSCTCQQWQYVLPLPATFLVLVFAKCISNAQLRCILVRIEGDELRP